MFLSNLAHRQTDHMQNT